MVETYGQKSTSQRLLKEDERHLNQEDGINNQKYDNSLYGDWHPKRHPGTPLQKILVRVKVMTVNIMNAGL